MPYYILHGEDEFGRSTQLAEWKSKMAADSGDMAELNTSVLDGRTLTMGELRHVCDSPPFLAKRRLVIVQDLGTRLGAKVQGRRPAAPAAGEPAWKKAFLGELADYLPRLPKETRLVFLETASLLAFHPMLKMASSHGREGGAYVQHFPLYNDDRLRGWVERRAREQGGRLSTEATTMLVELIGPDLRLLDHEIEKLLLYAEGRQVTTDDVRALVSRAREASIFALADCIGRRETADALRLLAQMLEQEAPLYILSMLARHVRILMQVAEASAQSLGKDAMAKALDLNPFVVGKALAQVPAWTMDQLRAAHEKLIETDRAIKTGELEETLALDLLVVALTTSR